MVLIWGLSADAPITAVREALCSHDTPHVFLDQHAALETQIEIRVDAAARGVIRVGAQVIALDSITAAYLRPHDSRRLPVVASAGEGSAAWQHAAGVEDALMTWCELTSAFLINRPSAMASNGSKPYQSAFIRSGGFETPDTLVTSDPAAAFAFWERHRNVIYKSVSGIRSIVSRLTPAHRARFDDLVWCPTQFQEYVTGRDYRVHVVGSTCFACEIVSKADDYRYAGQQGGDVDIRPFELTDEVAARCRSLASDLNLPVAGIDLRRTPEGAWYCFEVNPSPGFTYYESWTGQKIADAVASLLERTGI